MEKKAQLTIIGAAIILVTVVTITYGFFVSGVNNDNPQTATITTGTMELTFADNDNGVAKQMIFGESIEKKFTIENTGTVDAHAYLYWKNLTNTYLEGSLVYKLICSETADGENLRILKETNVPSSKNLEQLSNKLTIPANKTYYYTLTITLVNSETVDQTADLSASFMTGFDIKVDGTAELFVEYPVMMKNWREKCSLTDEYGFVDTSSITIVNEAEANIIASADDAWDISEAQDKSVMGYVIGEDIIIAGNGSSKIALPKDSSHIFEDLYCDFNGLELFDTSNVTNMEVIFGASYISSTASLSEWDVSNVTNMSGMFNDCYVLTSIDGLAAWDVSNVTDMSYMISITQVTSLDAIATWDVSNVTNMEYMFGSSYKLLSIEGLINWDVSNVTNMKQMFYDCQKLTSAEALNNWTLNETVDTTNIFSYSKVTLFPSWYTQS